VIRPEDLRVTPVDEPGTVPATVTDVVYQGPRLRLGATIGGGTALVVSVVPSELPATPVAGDTVALAYRGRGLHTLRAAPAPTAAVPAPAG
jgi:hypothetical protein